MTTDNIKINSFPLTSILELDIAKKVNEHAALQLRAGIAEADAANLTASIQRAESIRVTATSPNGETYILFAGVPNAFSITTENWASVLSLSAVGHSASSDIKPEIRVFQNRRMTYSQMFRELTYADGYIVPGNADKAIGALLVQYQETDWQYACRIASRLGTVVVPDCTMDVPLMAIGIPKRGRQQEINQENYVTEKDLHEYCYLKKNGVNGISETDVTSYIFKSRLAYALCDSILFNGMHTLVYSIHSKLEGSVIYHTYTLRTADGFRDFEHFNERIVGASIEGLVAEIEEDQVRVDLVYDVSDRRRKWFAYSTPYSSPDGTGWYFMPEKGDQIRLHFPTQKENDAYVISSTHVTHGDRSDPTVKFIRTIRGQAITFHPDSIHITDGKGSDILMDPNGIEIKTNKGIRMQAGEYINATAQGKINISGKNGVHIKQNDSLIHVDETIDISAGHVRIQ